MAQYSFTLSLNTVISSDGCTLANPCCEMSYYWDYKTNTGSAKLAAINGSRIGVTLYAAGIEGQLTFISDIHLALNFNVQNACEHPTGIAQALIYRVILTLDENGENPSAALMLGENGSCILATENFTDLSTTK